MAGKRKTSSLAAKARLLLLGISLAGASVLCGHTALASTKQHTHPASSHVAPQHSHLKLASVHHSHVPLRRSHIELVSSRHKSIIRRATIKYRPHEIHAAEYQHSRLQCVPYAREVSHIDITGNAFLWWAKAAGRYARGSTPVEGAVLNFRSIGRMPLGHVAVVTSVINSRTILVTQANWIPGTITNDVTMQDVSPDNNWSEVQVELGDSSRWGAAYPTYGFIYNHPANSTIIAATGETSEVAEAPPVRQVRTAAPDRNLQ